MPQARCGNSAARGIAALSGVGAAAKPTVTAVAPLALRTTSVAPPLVPATVVRPSSSGGTGPSCAPTRCRLRAAATLLVRLSPLSRPGAQRLSNSEVARNAHHAATAPGSMARPRASNAQSAWLVAVRLKIFSMLPENLPGADSTCAGFSALVSAPSLPPRPISFSLLAVVVSAKPCAQRSNTCDAVLAVVTPLASMASQRGNGRVATVAALPSGEGMPTATVSSRTITSGSSSNSATSTLSAKAGVPLACRSGASAGGRVAVANCTDSTPPAGGSHAIDEPGVKRTPRSPSGAPTDTSVSNHGPIAGDARPRLSGAGTSGRAVMARSPQRLAGWCGRQGR